MGIGAAAIIFFQAKPVYQSTAKLLVRYVIERSHLDQVDQRFDPHQHREAVMRAEIEILTSWDLAVEVARTIGADRLVQESSEGKEATEKALENVLQGLHVEAPDESNVLLIHFRHPDPEIPQETLNALIPKYFELHLKIHRDFASFDVLTQRFDQTRAMLAQTESELQERKNSPDATELELSKLERRVAELEEQFSVLTASLDKARIDEALNSASMPNISIIQKASPAMEVPARRSILLMAAIIMGGFLLGIVLACLFGNRSRRTKRAS